MEPVLKADDIIYPMSGMDISETNENLDPEKKLGLVKYRKWGTEYNKFFSLDLRRGRLKCFKKLDSKKSSTTINLIKGFMLERVGERCLIFKTKKGKAFQITPLEGVDPAWIEKHLRHCFGVVQKSRSKAFFAYMGRGVIKVVKLPFKMTSGIIVSLEKSKENAQSSPSKEKRQKRKRNISNPATGFAVGTGSIMNELLGAITGLITEPIKGAKNGGIKGATTGLGKGLVGLIFKPVAGTIDLVTYTARGVGNMPGAIYRNMFKVLKKKKKSQKKNEEEEIDKKLKEEGLEKVAENDDEVLYVNKNENLGISGHLKKNASKYMKRGSVTIQEPIPEGREDDFTVEQRDINKMMEFYQRNENKDSGEISEDEMKEFIVLRPHEDLEKELVEHGEENDIHSDSQEHIIVEEEKTHRLSNFKSLDKGIAEKVKHRFSENKGLLLSTPQKSAVQGLPDFVMSSNPFLSGSNEGVNREKSNSVFSTPVNVRKSELPLSKTSSNERVESKRDSTDIKFTKESGPLEKENAEKPEELKKKKTQSLDIISSSDTSSDEEENQIFKHIDLVEYNRAGREEIKQMAQNFKFIQAKDEDRGTWAYKNGGRFCWDNEDVKFIRNVGKEMVREVGRKIVSGTFNLTTVSFPIKAMIPRTALETCCIGTSLFPLYMTRAINTSDPLERLKLVITASVGTFYIPNPFYKPLNPVLGETLQASYNDGTQVYVEQISHHPPISYFLVYGPNKAFTYSGHYLSEAKAGLNTLTIYNKGKRVMRFRDGQVIEYNFGEEAYSGTFLGTMRHESLGKILFTDKKNNLTCELLIGKVKKRPSDYFEGEIKKNGTPICKVFGTYLCFIEFDGARYWDHRFVAPFKLHLEEKCLDSDHSRRKDRNLLKKAFVKEAQEEKINIENLQRKDAKLRKEYSKVLKKH